jgi:hypothetical protein
MELSKIFIFFLISSFIFAFSLHTVSAISISPASVEIDFTPNYQDTFTFKVEASKDIETYTRGELTEDVSLSEIKKIGEGLYEFSATLKLPDNIEKPGKHRLLVGVRETNRGKGSVAALAAVQVAIDVFVPYPGKYLEISLDAPDVKLNETADFVIHINNLGIETVTAAGTITIEDPAGKTLATLQAESDTAQKEIIMKTTESADLYASWNTAGQKKGVYKAKATVTYDDQTAKDEKTFRIGELYIAILNWTKKAQQDSTNNFDIEVESMWNDKIEGIFGHVNITKENKQVSVFKTITFSLEPWERKTITGYWDTTGLTTGSYDANITVYYGGKSTSISDKVEIVQKEKPAMPQSTLITITLIIIIVIVINIIIWLVILKKKSSEKEKKVKGKSRA